MTHALLVGFVGEIAGNELDLVSMDPVVEVDDKTLVMHSENWETSARPVAPEELAYVHLLPVDERVQIVEGEVVWAAGRNLVAQSASIAALSSLYRDLGTWKVYNRGVRWRTGTSRGLDEIKAKSALALEQHLHNCLFDRLEMTHGDLSPVFSLYLAMDSTKTLRRARNMGLYYQQTRNVAGYQRARERAVVGGLTRDVRTFDESVEALRDWLAEQRLSEAVGAGRSVAVGLPDGRARERDASTRSWYPFPVLEARAIRNESYYNHLIAYIRARPDSFASQLTRAIELNGYTQHHFEERVPWLEEHQS